MLETLYTFFTKLYEFNCTEPVPQLVLSEKTIFLSTQPSLVWPSLVLLNLIQLKSQQKYFCLALLDLTTFILV